MDFKAGIFRYIALTQLYQGDPAYQTDDIRYKWYRQLMVIK